MAGRRFLGNGKMAYTCNLTYGNFAEGGKFHVFGEYAHPENGKTYMLKTSCGSGGWQIYSSQDANPAPLKFGMYNEFFYNLDECQFMFRDERPHKVYIGSNMAEGYRSLCVWSDTQLGSTEAVGKYNDFAALQTILRKDGSPLQISLVAAESLSVATESTASIAVNTEDIDASANFRFYLGSQRREPSAFDFNRKESVTQGYATGTVVSNNQEFQNVVLSVEGIDSAMSLSWIDQSDKAPIWFNIGAGSVKDAEIITDPEQAEPEPDVKPWKALQAAIDAGAQKIRLVKSGETPPSGYAAVYTDENGVVRAESDDTFLHIAAGKNVTPDLNGNTIHRNLDVSTPDGNAVKIEGALTLEDSAGGGIIQGGNNYDFDAYGGGVLVGDGGTFRFSGGSIADNTAIIGGGAFNNESNAGVMDGGEISSNEADGGGIANYNKTPSEAKITKGGTDVTANYDITYVGGKLTVEKVLRSFPLTFYADSAGETVDQKHEVLSGASLSGHAPLKLENTPWRTFAGWSLEKGVAEYHGNEDKVIDWDKLVMPEEPLSVYPVWVENQLTILLDLNAVDEHNKESWYDGTKFDAASPASMDAAQERQLWKKIGETPDMTRMNAATRPGYTLNGWRTKGGMFWDPSWKINPEYCDRDENGPSVFQYEPDYRGWYYTITLTAQWAPERKKSSVLYDLNGGTGNIVDNATYVVNDLLTIVAETPTPPEGKLFAGWPDKAGNLYQPGDSGIYASEDWLSVRDGEEGLWMTARYEDIPEPDYSTITFRTGGGSMVAPVTLEPGATVAVPENPTRIGYEFAGWDTPIPETMPDEDLTVTAQWTPNRYTIAFDAGRGSNVTPITQDFGTPVEAPASSVLTGYTFAGWDSELPATMPAKDMELKAVWTINSYTLTFDTDGGSELAPRTGIYGALVVLPDAPTKDGFVFDGWDKEIPSTVPAVNMTVTAKWLKKLDATATDYGGVYDGQPHGITVNAPEGATVTYSETENGVYGATNPAYKDAGEYVVYYKVTADGATEETGSAKVSIAQKEITVSGIAALDKDYDGTTEAKFDYDGVKFDGMADGDGLTVSAEGSFADAEPGKGKTVVISALTPDGSGAKNYRLADSGQQSEATADIIAPAPELSTTIYAVKQAADGSRTLENAAPLETSDEAAYQVTELYKDGHFHIAAYSVGAYADESGRTAVSAGENIALDNADGKLYLYFARDAFDLTFYADVDGKKVLKTEKILYGASLSDYAGFALDDTELATFAGWSLEKGVTVYNDGEGNLAKEIDWNGLTMSAEPPDAYPISKERCDRDADGNVVVGYDEPYRNHIYTLTLTAKWKIDISATVEYDLNGGSGTVADNTAYPFNAYVTASETAPTPPESRIFVGWLDSAGTLHNPGDSFPFSDMALRTVKDGKNVIVLTAQYVVPKGVMITFDTDGGTAIAPVTADAGEEVSAPANPVKTGYTFAGWDKPFPTNMPVSDLALKAGWTINSYTLTFDTGLGSPVAPVTLEYGAAASAANPSRKGYEFAGWSPELPETMPGTDLTVKALWNRLTYDITFVTHGAAEVNTLTLSFGDAVTVPTDPEKDYYVFRGWSPELPAVMPAKNLTAEAVWEPKTYAIDFDTDGGGAIVPIAGIYGARVAAPENPVKKGYVFNGWNPAIPNYMPAENLTVTAQ